MPRLVVRRFRSWESFRKVVSGEEMKGGAFRGQASAEWPLYSSLSRYLLTYGVNQAVWPEQESRILRIFKRKAHLLLEHLPAEDDSFEWLALMQHHGAPTRLLDFTWSPFVAAFFALERATSHAAVWALFPPALTHRSIQTVRASQRIRKDEVAPWVPGGFERFFLPNERRIVIAGEPHRMNQRLIAQSGTFAMPGLLDTSIEKLVDPKAIIKFELDVGPIRAEAMAELYSMNISNATLFPGLDGLARSLGYELEFHWAFDPRSTEGRAGFTMK